VNDAIFGGVNGKVTAHFGASTTALGHADLAHDNLTGLNLRTTINLNAEALTWTVVNIFGGTASFDV
jgi:hypothetical protein